MGRGRCGVVVLNEQSKNEMLNVTRRYYMHQ